MKGTIKSSEEVSKVFQCGTRLKAKDLTLIVLRNESQHDRKGRVAFIAGKKNGNAVWRNRAKRRMRALYRDLGRSFHGYDVVFLANRTVNEADYFKMLARTDGVLKEFGIAGDWV